MNTNSQKCLLCGKPSVLVTNKKTGYKEPEVFSIWYCDNCNTSFSMPRVNPDSIYELIYRHASKLRGYKDYLKLQQDILKKKNPLEYLKSISLIYYVVEKIVKKKKKQEKGPLILEVGSGLGYLTYALNKSGYTTLGIDISQTAVDDAIEKFGNYFICDDIYNYSISNPESVDVVILTEVIEHVEDPISFLEALSKVLKKGGNIFLTSPNKSYFPKDTVWTSENPPVHLWWFSEDSMKYIAKKINLGIDFFDFSNVYKARMMPPLSPVVYNYALDTDGNPINDYASRQKNGLFSKKAKETKMYKLFSQLIYPIISRLFYSPKKSINTICAIFTK